MTVVTRDKTFIWTPTKGSEEKRIARGGNLKYQHELVLWLLVNVYPTQLIRQSPCTHNCCSLGWMTFKVLAHLASTCLQSVCDFYDPGSFRVPLISDLTRKTTATSFNYSSHKKYAHAWIFFPTFYCFYKQNNDLHNADFHHVKVKTDIQKVMYQIYIIYNKCLQWPNLAQQLDGSDFNYVIYVIYPSCRPATESAYSLSKISMD